MLRASVRLSASAAISRALIIIALLLYTALGPQINAVLVTTAAVPPKLMLLILNTMMTPVREITVV